MSEIPLTEYSPIVHAAAGASKCDPWYIAELAAHLFDIYGSDKVRKVGRDIRERFEDGKVPTDLADNPLTACVALLVLAVNADDFTERTFVAAFNNVINVLMKDSGMAQPDFFLLVDAKVAEQIYDYGPDGKVNVH